ncbi:TIGR01777 family protein [Seongchinamella sediminis]|uniref:TIGR01777 family protein n=1 Tax=Seongchinamella sediminis TaxID=2283635 RepID=A0A3L7E0P4_9GAMM|nr:TIGR01777 family oxidoreductase [Seongchinamella sediminis]RLQ23076.1 TIGR01777 family protein [Seongchinamella sediminis]
MHILITGGTGFIGEALVPALRQQQHTLRILTRQSRAGGDGVDYIKALDDIPREQTVHAVINLAGASLADRRWSGSYKREIVNSRLDTTAALVNWLAGREQRPEVLLSGSAIGYYGHHGDERLDENGSTNPCFAQALCQQWEAKAGEASGLGVRTCLLRLGVVLDSGGGAFLQMARPFRFGIGNWIGDGHQWLSWIHRADVVSAMLFLLAEDSLSGPFNLTAPEPVTSRGFCEAMQKQRRTIINAPVPAAAMRLLLGEMAEELLINGQRVVPARLRQAGLEFRYPSLDAALRDILAA